MSIYTNPKTGYVAIKGTKLKESSAAVQFSVTHVGARKLEKELSEWFPLSQMINSFTNPNAQGEDWIMVTEWICIKKGFIKE